jgi:hypothetical protein
MGSPQIIKIRSVYNNLKSIVKDSEVDDYHSLDEDFFDALKKYNKTRKSFEFEKLLDVIVGIILYGKRNIVIFVIMFNIFYIIIQGIVLWHLCFFFWLFCSA